ncbi:MAG: hypothetical protein JST82_01595 [Bacteroidetes bacterium]|nr:hypothetical protein [Bacteroidota bacterium]
MKISVEQANILFSALPADVAVVADEHEADETTDVESLALSLTNSIATNLRPQLEQEMRPSIEGSFMARYLGTLRSIVSREFNINRRRLDKLTMEEIVAQCKTVQVPPHEELPEKTEAADEELKAAYELKYAEMKASYEQMMQEERNKYAQKDIATRCLSMIEKLPRKGGDLQEQADMLRYKMQSAYEVRYNEATKKLEFYKEGQQVVSENNQPLNDEDFARNWAEKAGILVNDTRHILPADVKAGQQGHYGTGVINLNGDTQNPTAMDAIAAWVEQ